MVVSLPRRVYLDSRVNSPADAWRYRTSNIYWDAEANINHRSSAAFAYIYPEDQQRDDLTILTEHIVSKVVFSGEKATGVEFGSIESGELYTMDAEKEVLLAAGALGVSQPIYYSDELKTDCRDTQSPPILERSGVGSQALLEALNISVVVDLPGVGLNLQDQPGTSLSALLTQAAAANSSLVDGVSCLFISRTSFADLFLASSTPCSPLSLLWLISMTSLTRVSEDDLHVKPVDADGYVSL